MLMFFFISPISVISTEKDVQFTNASQYQLSKDVVKSTSYFDIIPSNPTLSQEINAYQDVNLTMIKNQLEKDQGLKITNLMVNDNRIPVFQLSDGSFVEASRYNIYDDVVQEDISVQGTFWLNKQFTVFDSPYVTGTKKVDSQLKSYNQVTVTEKATTAHGVYFKVGNNQWISQTDLSIADNRIAKVQEMLNQKYNKSQYAISVKQLNSQAVAGINQDKVMYSASVAKLAILYYAQEQLQNGSIKKTDTYKYVDAVNHFNGDYDPSGSGKMPKKADNKEYSVEDLLKAVAQHSDNVATNMLGYYVAHQYDNQFQSEINAISGFGWDMEQRQLPASAATKMMEAIYYQNGDIVSYLSNTEFDSQRISKNINVKVAHKIGDAYDYKHDVAIIYANEPYILTVFTDKSEYDDITAIADDVYEILK